MKKTIAFLVSVLVIAGSLSACSGNPATSAPSSEASGVSDASSPSGDTTGAPDGSSTETADGSAAGNGTTAANSSGGNQTKAPTPTGGSGSKDPTSGVNLGGATINIMTHNKNGIFNREKGTTLYGDACANRLATLQQKLNCKINVTVKGVDDMQTLAFNTIASGKAFAHILEAPVYKSFAYISSELITNLKTVSTMDLSQSYLNAGDAVHSSTLGKGTWFVGTEDMYAPSVMGYFFNKRILKESGIKENPYDLVRQNKWTVQKLRDMAKAATKDKDGKPGMSTADQYGILQTSYSADATEALFAAVGAQMLKTDGKGGVTYNMDSKEVINAISLANQIFKKDGTAYSTSSNDEELHKLFMTGHGLFLGAGAGVAKTIMDMDDDFGFVPFPRGDNASSIVGATNWNSSTLMIPAGLSSKELADAGSFLQAFCYLAPGVAKTMYGEYSDRYYRDDDSSDMLARVATNQKLAAATILGSASAWDIHGGTYKVLYACVPGDQSAEKMVQETKNATVAALKDQMAHIS